MNGFVWLIPFYRIKALSEDAIDIRLADKSIRVDGFDDMEDELTLLLASEHGNDMHGLLAIPPLSIQDSHTTMDSLIDSRSDLGIFARENEELHRLTHTRHDPIECCRIANSHT